MRPTVWGLNPTKQVSFEETLWVYKAKAKDHLKHQRCDPVILNFSASRTLTKESLLFQLNLGLSVMETWADFRQKLFRDDLQIPMGHTSSPTPISRFQNTAQKSWLCPSAALPYPRYLPSGILFSLVTLLLIHKIKQAWLRISSYWNTGCSAGFLRG